MVGARSMNRAKTKNTVRLLPFLPDGMVTDRSSPSRVRYAAKNAPLTAPGRSAHPPARKEREILGMANQNLLDLDRPSHGRPFHSNPLLGRQMSVNASRVKNRRSGFSLPVAIGDAFASSASIRFGLTLFPLPAHRTGQADFPHPALGKDTRLLIRKRVTPSATSEHTSGWLDSSSIPMSFVACCIRL